MIWAERGPMTPEEVMKRYENGWVGAYHSQRQKEKLLSEVTYADGADAAYRFGFVGSGKGKLSLPYRFAYEHWPNCWPCPGQETGDCTSHAGKNCGLVTIGVEASLGIADEVSGVIEGFPVVSALAEKQGVVACENIYGERGHRGQGASCSRLIRYVTTGTGGIMLRKDYPDLGINLEKYSVNLGIRWGGTKQGTPSEVDVVGRQHSFREATECKNHEIARDFISMGFPIWSCSDLGFSNERDKNGFSRRRGSWGHSWIIGAYDDRPETVRHYGHPNALFIHDWGRWNDGGRRILGTQYDIPEGAMWIDATLLNSCDLTAMGGQNGWPRPKLPDYESGVF